MHAQLRGALHACSRALPAWHTHPHLGDDDAGVMGLEVGGGLGIVGLEGLHTCMHAWAESVHACDSSINDLGGC